MNTRPRESRLNLSVYMAILIPSLGFAHFDSPGQLRLAERLKALVREPGRSRPSSHRRQLCHPQDPRREALAQVASSLPSPLHADLGVLAQYGGALLRRDHPQTHPAQRLRGRAPEDVEVSREPRADGLQGNIPESITLPPRDTTFLTISIGEHEVHAQRLP